MIKPNKIKVLFLIHTLQIGGAERVLVDLVNAMSKDRFDVTVMTVVDLGDLKNQLDKNIKYDSIFRLRVLKKFAKSKSYGQTINASPKKNLLKEAAIGLYKFFWRHANIKRLYRRHIKENYDIEVSFLEGIPAKIISNSTNAYSKKIVWLHVDLLNENKSDAFFKNLKDQKSTYDKFNQIICVSEVVKTQAIKKYRFADTDKLSVIYNPIDKVQILKKSKERALVKKSNFTFCTVGRLAHQKGYDRLLRVAKKLEDDGLNFSIWIIGVGTEEGRLKKMQSELNVKSVKFLGYQKNPYPYVKAADAFVCSSRAEGFSTVVSEAVILGKPVITTDCSGMKEILGDNSEYGLICKNDEAALYKAMKKFLINENIYKKYCQAVKTRKKIFDPKKSVHTIEQMFTEAVK